MPPPLGSSPAVPEPPRPPSGPPGVRPRSGPPAAVVGRLAAKVPGHRITNAGFPAAMLPGDRHSAGRRRASHGPGGGSQHPLRRLPRRAPRRPPSRHPSDAALTVLNRPAVAAPAAVSSPASSGSVDGACGPGRGPRGSPAARRLRGRRGLCAAAVGQSPSRRPGPRPRTPPIATRCSISSSTSRSSSSTTRRSSSFMATSPRGAMHSGAAPRARGSSASASRSICPACCRPSARSACRSWRSLPQTGSTRSCSRT